MTGLDELISRLEKATGPNYALEVDIFKSLNPEYADYVQGRGGLVHPCDGEDQRVQSNVRAPNYTASIDSALLLLNRLLPGWYWRVGHGSVEPGWAHLNRVHPDHCDRKDEASGKSATPALALCVAVLRAAKELRL